MNQDLTFVINIAKVTAWAGCGFALWRLAKELHRIYQLIYAFLMEHRMVTADLWERRPDKEEEYKIMLAIPLKAKSHAAGRRQ